MAPAMKIVLGLLTFVTVGMIIGNYHFPTTKLHTRQSDGHLRLPIGLSHWHGDQEAEILRLGYECDYLKAIALPRLQVSTVVDAKTGMGIKSKVRTSSGMFLRPNERKCLMIQVRFLVTFHQYKFASSMFSTYLDLEMIIGYE
ncbi:hypothetical protein GOBAR_AA01018 [Gossypium barbadense]|uniref:Uncharacterized protein n=1 Tax=Gossypium barbadense TaxID=3634 RepID=A0A2P5YVC7_GOSBA|nr:hypothetical protein GOBAR_AA01018 [Gossypium barbadense]